MNSSELTKGIGIVGGLIVKALSGSGFGINANAGAPTNGTSGTWAGTFKALPYSLLIDTTNGGVYQNTNTKASPTWSPLGSTAIGQFATSLTVGGTGVAGAATTSTLQTKKVTAYSNGTAKDTWTVTVPNAEHNAVIEFNFLGILGAGGAIGEGEASLNSRYTVTLARTAGVAVVAGVSSAQDGAIEAHVAGGDAITSVVATLSAVAGGVTVANTFTVKVAITRSGAGATNHICVTSARVLNANATGVTIA